MLRHRVTVTVESLSLRELQVGHKKTYLNVSLNSSALFVMAILMEKLFIQIEVGI